MRPPTEAASLLLIRRMVSYLSAVEMLVNLAFNCVPRPLTTAMIAMEMPAAIRPYSMAVAPDSFFRNATSLDFCGFPLLSWAHLNLESATRGHYDAF